MEQDGANQSQNMPSSAVSLCRLGCGFYATTAFDGLCSKCYKDVLKRQKQGLQTTVQSSASQAAVSETSIQTTQPEPVTVSSTPSTHDQSLTGSTGSNPTRDCGSSDAPSSEIRSTVCGDASSVCSAMNLASISCAIMQGSRVSPVPESRIPTVITELGAQAGFMQDNDTSSVDDDNSTESSSTPSDAEAKSSKPKKNRCHTCKKKVALTGFECRCGGLYCSIHRYSDMHQCRFNYKEHGQEELRKSNPVVVSSKIQKI